MEAPWLSVLHTLADRGNTVVVIEHHLDVIKTADWVIDLGPDGGDGGGTLVAQGTPEQVAQIPASYTGAYLAQVLGLPGKASLGSCSRASSRASSVRRLSRRVGVDGSGGRAARIEVLLREVPEDLPDHPRLGDERDDPRRPAAA
jgi:hypothetical protein